MNIFTIPSIKMASEQKLLTFWSVVQSWHHKRSQWLTCCQNINLFLVNLSTKQLAYEFSSGLERIFLCELQPFFLATILWNQTEWVRNSKSWRERIASIRTFVWKWERRSYVWKKRALRICIIHTCMCFI